MIAVHKFFVGAQLLARVILASPATTDNSSSNFHAPRVTPPPHLEQALRRDVSNETICGYVSGSYCMLSLMQRLRAIALTCLV
jgi:hypothetical protein